MRRGAHDARPDGLRDDGALVEKAQQGAVEIQLLEEITVGPNEPRVAIFRGGIIVQPVGLPVQLGLELRHAVDGVAYGLFYEPRVILDLHRQDDFQAVPPASVGHPAPGCSAAQR